jgi:Arc/MetJ-type ribon-helix-helix transcriptional regulator
MRVPGLTTVVSVAALSIVLGGCDGGNPGSAPPPGSASASPPVKAMLEDLAKTGELGSGTEAIQQAIEALKATDAAKADELSKDFADLQKSSNNPAQVKTKAAAMAAKL